MIRKRRASLPPVVLAGAGLLGVAGVLALLAPAVASSTETQFWQVGTFDDFLRGDLKGVSLSKQGALELAPPTQTVFDPGQTLALSLAADKEGRIYIGTGHEGKVFQVDTEGHGKLLFQAPEPEILAVAAGPDGAVYAASSPDGKIYRITSDGKSSVFFDPKTKYIWSLIFDGQGRLYSGTGDQGMIYQIDSEGKGRVFFESRQTHIICLALDHEGNLLAGSDPDGLLFRITPQGKGFVLYKAAFPEIHALALDSEGRIYAAALGGSGATPTMPVFGVPATPAPEPTAVTTVTVTASAGAASDDTASGQKNRQQPPTPQPSPPHQAAPQRTTPNFNRPAASPLAPPQAPAGRGALVRVAADNSTETLWNSDKESIFGLAVEGRNVLFSTDGSGRIFRLSPSPDGPQLTLVTETHETLATRLLVQRGGVYVTTSDVAKLFRLGAGPVPEGSYESPVKDAKFISRWGNLSWRADVPAGSAVEFYSRAGNSERPDNTWSDWVGPYSNPDGSPIKSPAARYLQWKAVLKGSGAASPVLKDVTVAFLNQNLAPEIRGLDVSTGGERSAGPGGISGAAGVGMGASAGSGFGGSASSAGQNAPTTITWQADDPNGDRLVYWLYLKAPDEQEWHLVKARMHETTYVLDPTTVPDGEYRARVVASDEESNPPAEARRAETVSAPFWIDNTPPDVDVTEQRFEGTTAEIHFKGSSTVSPLRSAELSVDGGEWRPLVSDDGIIDSRSETFTVHLSSLGPGEHQVLLRVGDTAGNTGVGKAVLSWPPGGAGYSKGASLPGAQTPPR
ncbi:MAG TPA: hypothetical protein VL523_19585 [Terriglobia bacterium]|nr:hypothetical protein [Terriglobia bacterium]